MYDPPRSRPGRALPTRWSGSHSSRPAAGPGALRQELEDWAPTVARYLGEVSLLDAQWPAAGDARPARAERGHRGGLQHRPRRPVWIARAHRQTLRDVRRRDPRTAHRALAAGLVHPGDAATRSSCIALDLAGLSASWAGGGARDVPGRQPAAAIAGQGGRTPDVFSMYYGNQFGFYTQRMVRDRRWKYVWNATPRTSCTDLRRSGRTRNRMETPPAEIVDARRRGWWSGWRRWGDSSSTWIRDQLLDHLKP